MPGISDVRHLGDYIREQRSSSQISLRQLAKLAGVSNPYLSQIERGLRKPSAEILQQIAKGLRVSAEAMYVQAGILEHREGSPVVDSVLADDTLTERQKQVLLEIHESFRKENAAAAATAAAAAALVAESSAALDASVALMGQAAPAEKTARRTAVPAPAKAAVKPRAVTPGIPKTGTPKPSTPKPSTPKSGASKPGASKPRAPKPRVTKPAAGG